MTPEEKYFDEIRALAFSTARTILNRFPDHAHIAPAEVRDYVLEQVRGMPPGERPGIGNLPKRVYPLVCEAIATLRKASSAEREQLETSISHAELRDIDAADPFSDVYRCVADVFVSDEVQGTLEAAQDLPERDREFICAALCFRTHLVLLSRFAKRLNIMHRMNNITRIIVRLIEGVERRKWNRERHSVYRRLKARMGSSGTPLLSYWIAALIVAGACTLEAAARLHGG